MKNSEVLAKGMVERIGLDGSNLKHEPSNSDKIKIEQPIEDHNVAMRLVLDALIDKKHGVISDLEEINAVGHRVVHGAEKFSDSVIVDEKVIAAIEECCEIAPLHNPANLMGIRACKNILPKVPNVAVFDTAFHQTMPSYAYLYGLTYEAYSKYGIRRYGFHGTSHKFVANRYAQIVGKDIKNLKLITCHLGNGSSITAVDGGKSVDTSMGYTPLEGLVMGTRSGDIDPAIVPYLMDKMNMTLDKTISYLNKNCGVLGLSGVSSDFRDLWDAADEGNKRAQTALDVFCYRVKKYIGAYAAAMGGVDAIIFTAGIGENDIPVRKISMEGLSFLGVRIDEERNNIKRKEIKISTDDSKVEVWCIPTNEELAIANETYTLCK